MSGIFISYRRIDAKGWAGRLFDHLSSCFGKDMVFMDIEGGIPRGADFEKVLTTALANCDALLALIGPDWVNCKHSDGMRRLDIPDDWVRNEIAMAIQRDILVVPVMIGTATLPEKSQLPEELHPLLKRQKADVADDRWEDDVRKLIKDLTKLSHLKPLDDVAAANTGIRLLKELITTVPVVADAVSRSKEVINSIYSQVAKLELFKTLHDALHTIEFECLRPMKYGGSRSRFKFTSTARLIQETIKDPEINSALRDDLNDQLELISAEFQAAMETPCEDVYSRLVDELEMLVSNSPLALNTAIVNTAAELDLSRLVQLMATVRDQLPPQASENDAEIAPFINGINALQRLCDDLSRLVTEHSQLQSLNSVLRGACSANTTLPQVNLNWKQIKRVHARLVPPFSPELEAANNYLTSIESAIDTAIADSQQEKAFDHIGEYFEVVRTVFRDVDTSLKDFCMRLSSVNQPLKTILDMC